MDVIFSTLIETEWGLIVLGAFLIGALLVEIFTNNKPKT